MTGIRGRRAGLRPSALGAVVLATVALLLSWQGPVSSQDTGWLIESFDVEILVRDDTSLQVVETIDVDFGSLSKHGIYRDIPVRYPVAPDASFDLGEDRTSEDVWRVLEVDQVTVSSTAPSDLEIQRPSRVSDELYLRMRIGDPEITISGRQSYTISYTVRGAFDDVDGHPELFWNATGNGWSVPIEEARLAVQAPSGLRQAVCVRGTYGATEICDARQQADFAEMTVAALAPGEGMSGGLVFEAGAFEVPAPLLQDKFTLASAFAGSPATWPLFVLAALVAFGGVGMLLYRQGRDRMATAGVTVDGHVAPSTPGPRPLFSPRAVGVRYRPPDDLRPALLGLLVDESVDPVDISATVVDLAVRGYLTIEEVENKILFWTRTDYLLRRQTDPVADDERGGLLDYEQMLLDGLFEDGDEVELSDLTGSFAATYQKVQRAIYNNGQKRGWFNARPDKTRSRWLAAGIGATVLSIGILVFAVVTTTFALAAVPLVLGAIALAVGHRWMPHRTAKGSRFLTETLGFREFVTEAETSRMEFAEEENIFVRYLPYAVVFGAVDRWAERFADLGVVTSTTVGGWYVSPHGFDAHRFSSGLSDFASTVGSSLSTVPSSSGGGVSGGGGFSGGGMGGGGGGSW